MKRKDLGWLWMGAPRFLVLGAFRVLILGNVSVSMISEPSPVLMAGCLFLLWCYHLGVLGLEVASEWQQLLLFELKWVVVCCMLELELPPFKTVKLMPPNTES